VAWSVRLLDLATATLDVALIGTLAEWLTVAEAIAAAVEIRCNRGLLQSATNGLRRSSLTPAMRFGPASAMTPSIAIVRVCRRPIRNGEHTFTFVREIVSCETHSGDAPAAIVAARAELLHHQAAFDTRHERDRFQLAAHAHETALREQGCERQRLAARRAASTALSEQINSNLLGRPLVAWALTGPGRREQLVTIRCPAPTGAEWLLVDPGKEPRRGPETLRSAACSDEGEGQRSDVGDRSAGWCASALAPPRAACSVRARLDGHRRRGPRR